MSSTWACPSCDYKTNWSFQEIAQKGTPVCQNCGDDMELEDKYDPAKEARERPVDFVHT